MTPIAVLTQEQIDALVGRVIKSTLEREAASIAEVLTREEAAELLRLSIPTLTKLVEREGLPAHRIGVEWRFRRSEVLQWLATRGTDVKLTAVKG